MPLSSKFLSESTGKNCENWSIFSKDMDKVQYLIFWPTLYIIVFLYRLESSVSHATLHTLSKQPVTSEWAICEVFTSQKFYTSQNSLLIHAKFNVQTHCSSWNIV